MLNYLLSNDGFRLFQIIIISFVSAPFIFIAIALRYDPSIKSRFFLTYLISVTILPITGIVLLLSTKQKIIPEPNWKQVYTNNTDSKVVITKNSEYDTLVHNDIIAGEKLGNDYKLFTVDSKSDIKIEKDNASYSKKISINKDNIIVNGELNEDSKITKIEYRDIQGVQRILFNHKGPIEKADFDGELRITIEQDPKQEELKQVFESQN